MARALSSSLLVSLLLPLAACSSGEASDGARVPAAHAPRDSAPDGLYRDFLDGKYDGEGHPIGAQIWQAEDGCNAETGSREAEGRAYRPTDNDAGLACSAASAPVGLGHFVLNVRALAFDACAGANCDAAALTLTVKNADGSLIDSKTIVASEFITPLDYRNVGLAFTHSADGPVTVEVAWAGQVGVRVDYVELFRSTRNILVTPPSGLFDPAASFVVELLDPPSGFSLGASCDGTDLTDAIAAALADGSATREDTEFRSTFTLPMGLVATCPLPSRVRFDVQVGTWVQATSRVSLYAEEPPCTFVPDTTRVLLTGFEPFPADSSHDNSSEQAVGAFDPAAVPGISLMTLTLPVEFGTAPGIVKSAVERCAPDVVLGFGQGRNQVDLETTAYNLEDSSDIAGGVPDNRGLIPGGVAIEGDGPAERQTALPADSILAALSDAGITAGLSDDPGRYVCNDVFYGIMSASEGQPRVGGFVHLPYIHTVDDADRATLKQVVTEVVSQAVAKQRSGP
jgi:pyroglutamyl-peptidase